MRIDKFLKLSRLIKRRTVANEACDGHRVTINDKVAKPSTTVKAGDKVSLAFGTKTITFLVLATPEVVKKDQASEMYRIIGEE